MLSLRENRDGMKVSFPNIESRQFCEVNRIITWQNPTSGDMIVDRKWIIYYSCAKYIVWQKLRTLQYRNPFEFSIRIVLVKFNQQTGARVNSKYGIKEFLYNRNISNHNLTSKTLCPRTEMHRNVTAVETPNETYQAPPIDICISF